MAWGDFLDLEVGHVFHDLARGLLAEGDEEDGHLLHQGQLEFLFLEAD